MLVSIPSLPFSAAIGESNAINVFENNCAIYKLDGKKIIYASTINQKSEKDCDRRFLQIVLQVSKIARQLQLRYTIAAQTVIIN
ncbi:MAG: hypothetical protein R3F37_01460 [Candidatus Competibacteraceae bacterium]